MTHTPIISIQPLQNSRNDSLGGAILAFKENQLDENGSRGTLIFTGATAAIRGNVTTSAFAAGKFGIRALSQSLAKEFGKENIHVGDTDFHVWAIF